MAKPSTLPLVICVYVPLVVALANRAGAAPAIEIEVAMQPGVPITAPQAWAERLGKLGLDRVQIRSARGDEQPAASLNDAGTRVTVLALLTARDELVVPQHRFRFGDVSKLKAYFAALPGELAEAGVERTLFHLKTEDFNKVLLEVEQPLGQATKGILATAVLDRCESLFHLPIIREPGVDALLRASPPLATDLRHFSAGTALAIALRQAGLTWRPVELENGQLQLVISVYHREQQSWPVGWKAEASPRQLAPKLYESLTIEIDGYTLATALKALGPRLGVPVVTDQWILERLDIHPDEISVKVARKKTYLRRAVDRLLSQARLVGELRIDERGKPFLWLTQYGADSRPAGLEGKPGA